MLKEIRIIIATPRPVQRSRLAKVLATHPSIRVVAQTLDLSETYTLSEKLEPDVVLLAVEYTHQAEFSCMKSQFYALGARWLVIAEPGAEGRGPRTGDPAYPAIHAQMDVADILDRMQSVLAMRAPQRPSRQPAMARQSRRLRPDRVVLIGASTGGVDALLNVIACFPADCPPTAIVQHTGRGFSESLIKLLDRRCAARVVAAENGIVLQPGMVCVAGGTDGHLRLQGTVALRSLVQSGAPVSGHLPSIDELFRSALPIADRVLAVLLTGMGRDGAEGMLALRRAGAATIGQDEASSVVYGMPRAAFELGAVQIQLGLDRIGPEILRQCQRESESPLEVR